MFDDGEQMMTEFSFYKDLYLKAKFTQKHLFEVNFSPDRKKTSSFRLFSVQCS